MFDPKPFITESVGKTKEELGDRKCIIGLSGGVDSSVAAVIVNKAVGENLVSVFVDTGFMRKNEGEQIRDIFGGKFGLNFRLVDASQDFMDLLNGVSDPEEKRKIIGHHFIEVFQREAVKEQAEVLVQGTIAPDWIETGGGIKSHHNLTLPDGMTLDIVEPLRDLYKDEVRKVARELKLPPEICERMPFPGPGLAVRVVGEIIPERVTVVREAEEIVREEINAAEISSWQAFPVVLPGRATGVKGDSRDYGFMVAVRVVDSIDAMTANVKEPDWRVLRKIADRITREIPGVTRVLYDLTNKPPATIEYE